MELQDYSRSIRYSSILMGNIRSCLDHPTRTFTPLRGLLIYKNFQSTTRLLPRIEYHCARCFRNPRSRLHLDERFARALLSLYLSYVILEMISVSIFLHWFIALHSQASFRSQTSPNARQVSHCDELVLQVYAALWLSSAAVSTLVDRICELILTISHEFRSTCQIQRRK